MSDEVFRSFGPDGKSVLEEIDKDSELARKNREVDRAIEVELLARAGTGEFALKPEECLPGQPVFWLVENAELAPTYAVQADSAATPLLPRRIHGVIVSLILERGEAVVSEQSNNNPHTVPLSELHSDVRFWDERIKLQDKYEHEVVSVLDKKYIN